jgi:very-short-patch-repair endonuclease
MPKEVNGIPKPLSRGEEEFLLHCRVKCLPTPEREVKFALPRQFRADFLFREAKLIVEVDGGTRANGRHNRHEGYERDCQKLNLATKLGYRVLRYTTEMVTSGEAIYDVMEALQ